jgi:hypothetical protein
LTTASKRKGDDYERALAAHINERLGTTTCARAPMSGGGFIGQHTSGSDLLGLSPFHIEAKRTERLNVREAMRQAEAAIAKNKSPDIPVVITRRNREAMGQSLVVMRLDAWCNLVDAYRKHHGL